MAKVAHLKGPEKEGNREPVYFATHADYVEGLTDRFDTQAEATPTKAGLMSAADKSKLDNISAGANSYSLPTASSSTLGGVKIGSGISISNGSISVPNATTSANGLMSSNDKAKLDGVANNANNYSLPTASSSALGGVKIGSGISISNGSISVPNATTSANGLMSSNDKAKLDGVANNANNYSLPTASNSTLGGVKIGNGISISNGSISVPNATTSANGLMSSNDKAKLDGVANNANNYSLPDATTTTKGGVKVGGNISVSNGTISITKDNVTAALGYTPSATNTTYNLATTSANGLMSSGDKAKLDGVANNANNYSLPTASSSTLGGVKIGSGISISNGSISVPNATTSANGLMSSGDKAKLDGVANNANNYSLPTASNSTLGGVKVGSNISVSSGTISITKDNVTAALGYTPPTTNTTYNVATTSANGLMSSSDKSKLDGVANTYVPRTKSVAFNIAKSSWVKNSSETSEFVYYADITVSGLTANDYAAIDFDRASQNVVVDANICASGETFSGKIRLYAEEIPASAISGEYMITKGVV